MENPDACSKALCTDGTQGSVIVSQSAQLLSDNSVVDDELNISECLVSAENIEMLIDGRQTATVNVQQQAQLIGPHSKLNRVYIKDTKITAGGCYHAVAHEFHKNLGTSNAVPGQRSNTECYTATQKTGSPPPTVQGSILTCIAGPHSQINQLTIDRTVVQSTYVQQLPKPTTQLPVSWNLPPKNENFVGRKDLLDTIAIRLGQTGLPLVLSALDGLGGVGKTSVALQFVWENYDSFRGVAWFNAETITHLEQDYINLGTELNILQGFEQATINQKANHVKTWLETPPRGDWLLVYDNAPGYGGKDGIGELIPTKKGTVLVTSRMRRGWPQSTLDVDVFKPEESLAYIEKILGQPIDHKDGALRLKLATTLGHLPLALAQACAFISISEMDTERYLALWERRKQTLLADKTLAEATLRATATQMCVFTTWDITMDVIGVKSPLATRWLITCAYFDGTAIQDFLLESFAEDQTNNPRDEIFDTARGILHAYSMIGYNKTTCCSSVHNVVQEVIRLKEDVKGQEDPAAVSAARVLEKCFPNGEAMADYAKQATLLPHFSTLRPILEQLSSKNKVHQHAYLLHIVNEATGLSSAGDAQRCVDLADKTLAVLAKQYGPENLLFGYASVNFGIAYGALGDCRKQQKLLEQAVSIFEQQGPGQYQRDYAVALTHLAGAYGNAGDYLRQKIVLEKALGILRESSDPNSKEIADVLENLGDAYNSLGDYHQGLRLLKKALEIKKLHYGPDHIRVSLTLGKLGGTYGSTGDYEAQKNILEMALKIQKQYYGIKHFETAQTLRALAEAYGSLGDHVVQKRMLEEALDGIQQHYGEHSVQVAQTQVLVGNASCSLGDYDEAEINYESALSIFKKEYGPDHIHVGLAQTSLADVYGQRKDYQRQKEVLVNGLQVVEKAHVSNSIEIARVRNNLANTYGNLGQYDKQRELLTQAVAGFEEDNHNHPDFMQMRDNLHILNTCTDLQIAVRLGDLGKVNRLLETGVDLFQKSSNGGTVLHHAVTTDREDVVRFILDKIDEWDRLNFCNHVNAKDGDGDTPLIWAALNGCTETAKFLLECGAEVDVQGSNGNTTLHRAAEGNFLKIVTMLVNKGANPNVKNLANVSPLSLAEKKLAQDATNETMKAIKKVLVLFTSISGRQ